MEIKIRDKNNNPVKFIISFDSYGNVYFDNTSYHSHNSYQINVNHKNQPYFEKDDFQILKNKKTNYNKLQLLGTGDKLKNEVLNDIKKYDTFDEYEKEIDYFPEQNEYVEMLNHKNENSDDDIISEDNIGQYGIYNTEFLFSKPNSNNEEKYVNIRKNGDVSALYDTYVYKNNLLFMKSSSKNNESIYTLKIHDDGTVYFKVNGSYECKYKLRYENEEIILI